MALFRAVRGMLARDPLTPPTPPAARARVPSAWIDLKVFVSACEAAPLDLCALHPSDCIGFFERRALIEGEVHAGVPIDRAARDHGFTDGRHWETVVRYFEARYSELRVDAAGVARIGFIDEFRRAEALVLSRLRDADARSLEPICGVGLERFAEVSAAIVRLGATPSRAALSRVLAELGVGAGTYGAVRRGWLARIAHDSTRSMQRRYQDAFLAARSRFATLLPGDEPEPRSVGARRSWADAAAALA